MGNPIERRQSLKILGAISATCAFPFSSDELFGQEHVHAPPPAQLVPAGPFTPKFFTKDELALVSRISDLIIPPTDTPGAIAAGVPRYIDSVLAGNPAMQKQFREELPKIGAQFLSLSETQQIAFLQPLSDDVDASRDKPGTPAAFFRAMKNLTCDGYYTSQAGLIQELGYKGNTVLAAFPECIHEH